MMIWSTAGAAREKLDPFVHRDLEQLGEHLEGVLADFAGSRASTSSTAG